MSSHRGLTLTKSMPQRLRECARDGGADDMRSAVELEAARVIEEQQHEIIRLRSGAPSRLKWPTVEEEIAYRKKYGLYPYNAEGGRQFGEMAREMQDSWTARRFNEVK